MGKDKKGKKDSPGDAGGFKTKDTLREEDVQLTRQLLDLEKRYRDVYRAVHELSVTYGQCKDHTALQRYSDLKTMIKACVTDETLQTVANYSAAGEPQESGKIVALVKAARQLSSGANEAAARDEIAGLHKAEIVKDLEEKEKRKEKLEVKFLRLHNRLQKLKRDYEESKQHIPTKRYLVMKEIIKPLIRDEALKVDL